MEEEIKDYILLGRQDDLVLNLLIDLIRTKIETGQPYVDGGLLNQPYFLVNYAENWVRQALEEKLALHQPLSAPQDPATLDFLVQSDVAWKGPF
jgi:hypothetical protein